MDPSYYELLELPRDADRPALDAAYERLSAQYDPSQFRDAAPEIRA